MMTDRSNFNYIIYHRGCLDGFAGFLVAYTSGRLNKDAEIYSDVPSTTNVPPNIDGKDIIIIDVAYKKDVMEIIFKYAKSVVFIDHHISIRDDVFELYKKYNKKDNIKIIYDDTKSGCTLAWKYFFGRQETALFLKYIEDQDIGRWLYPQTKPFIFALKAYYHLSTEKKSINKWFRLMNKEIVLKLIKKGKYMEKYNNHLVKVNLPRHTLERFPSEKVYNLDPSLFNKPGQYIVAVYSGLNCPSVTDLSNMALEKLSIDFCIMWVYNLDTKKYVMSMRSKETDVSQICKIFGGGGHKLAAACSFNSSEFIIDDMFFGSSLPRTIKQDKE
jgi:uncharacterized protein